MLLTPFNPGRHGFHFSNSDIAWTFGPFSSNALCGGMVYSALDYFLNQLTIPSDTTAPPLESTLQAYIYKRQVAAHVSTVPKFAGSWLPVLRPLFSDIQGLDFLGEFNKLVASLSTMTPVPVCLVGNLHGHHVLAIGSSKTAPPTMLVYDPNYPDITVTIQPVQGKGFMHQREASMWDGFFVDDGYRKETPPVLSGQLNWRWCHKCQGLFFFGNPTNGTCPKGGQHEAVGSGNYMLSLDSGSGQPNWRWCFRCEGLFFAGNAAGTGLCPAKGPHSSANSGNYILAINTGVGQPNWRLCRVCAGLFFAGNNSLGLCPANTNGHDGSISSSYVLPFFSD